MKQSSQNIELCAEFCPHPDRTMALSERMPSTEEVAALAELYRAFGDPTRVRILMALSHGEVCVCDLAELLGMSVSAVSHQLKNLKQSRLVSGRREGKTVFYALADDHVRTIIRMGLEHIGE